MNNLASGMPPLHTAEEFASLGPCLSITPQDTVAAHPLGRDLLRFYESHRERGTLPRRRELPCREILGVLPNLFMLEPLDADGADWRFRLVGQAIVVEFGGDPTGLDLSIVLRPGQLAVSARRFQAMAQEPRWGVGRGVFQRDGMDVRTFEVVSVPILAYDDSARWILGGIFFDAD